MTGSSHVTYQINPLACKHYGNEVAFQLLQNIMSGHVKVRKGTGHVFYMATPSHDTESISEMIWELRKNDPHQAHTFFLGWHHPCRFVALCDKFHFL